MVRCFETEEEAARREARSLLLRLSTMGRLRFEQYHGRMHAEWLLRLRLEAGYSLAPECDIQRRILGMA